MYEIQIQIKFSLSNFKYIFTYLKIYRALKSPNYYSPFPFTKKMTGTVIAVFFVDSERSLSWWLSSCTLRPELITYILVVPDKSDLLTFLFRI